MADFLSDEEMSKLEKQGKVKTFISDEEMASLENSGEAADFLSDEEMAALEKQGKVSDYKAGSAIKTFGANFYDSLSFGYMPQLVAGAEEAGLRVYDKFAGTKLADDKTYVQRRDDFINEMNVDKEANPGTAIAGQVGGVAASFALPAAGLLKSGQAAKTTAQGGGLVRYGKGLAKAGAVGGLLGAAANPGDEQGVVDPVQAGARINNAEFGLLTAPIGKAGADVLKAGYRGAKAGAGRLAFRAAGANAGDINRSFQKGRLEETGRQLLDDKIVTPFATTDDVRDRVAVQLKEKSSTVKRLLQEAQAFAAGKVRPLSANERQQLAAVEFKPRQVAQQIKAELREEFGEIDQALLKPVFDTVDKFFGKKKGALDIQRVHDLKVQLNKFIRKSGYLNHNGNPDTQLAFMSIQEKLRRSAEAQVDAVANLMGKQGGQLRVENRKFGNLIEVADNAERQAARELSNRSVSLTDALAASSGMTLGGIIGSNTGEKGEVSIEGAIKGALWGLSLGGVNKIRRTYGTSLAANAGHIPPKAVARMTALVKSMGLETLLKENPVAFHNMVRRIAESSMEIKRDFQNPEAREEYLSDDYLDQGPLMQQPSYDFEYGEDEYQYE